MFSIENLAKGFGRGGRMRDLFFIPSNPIHVQGKLLIFLIIRNQNLTYIDLNYNFYTVEKKQTNKSNFSIDN